MLRLITTSGIICVFCTILKKKVIMIKIRLSIKFSGNKSPKRLNCFHIIMLMMRNIKYRTKTSRYLAKLSNKQNIKFKEAPENSLIVNCKIFMIKWSKTNDLTSYFLRFLSTKLLNWKMVWIIISKSRFRCKNVLSIIQALIYKMKIFMNVLPAKNKQINK